MYPLRISVDGHRLTIISTDGYDIVPTDVESVIVNPGERYDFLLFTTNPVGNYWLRAESIEVRLLIFYYSQMMNFMGSETFREEFKRSGIKGV